MINIMLSDDSILRSLFIPGGQFINVKALFIDLPRRSVRTGITLIFRSREADQISFSIGQSYPAIAQIV